MTVVKLNLYNFQKVIGGTIGGGYYHPQFRRDKREKCLDMRIKQRSSSRSFFSSSTDSRNTKQPPESSGHERIHPAFDRPIGYPEQTIRAPLVGPYNSESHDIAARVGLAVVEPTNDLNGVPNYFIPTIPPETASGVHSHHRQSKRKFDTPNSTQLGKPKEVEPLAPIDMFQEPLMDDLEPTPFPPSRSRSPG